VAVAKSGYTISDSSKTVTIYYNAPTYGITLDKSGTHTFPAAAYGYSVQAALSVTVTNTGNQATGPLTIALSETNSGNFTLSKTSITDIAGNGTDTFTVMPNTGLSASATPYTATVTVSGGPNITSGTFDVSFTVNKAPGATISGFTPAFKNISSVEFTIDSATVPSAPANGQTIEYAFHTSSTTPSTGWQDGLKFLSSLSEETAYTIFARTKENTNYNAGTALASAKTLTIKTGMSSLFTALNAITYTYDGNSTIEVTGTNNLNSSVTIPSGINLEIKGNLKIASPSAVLTLNGTMTIKNGGTFEIDEALTDLSNSFTVESVLKGSKTGTILTVEDGGALAFPTTGTITSMLSGITNGDIVIMKNGQVTLNRVMSDGINPPTFSPGNFPFIGQTGFFVINQGQFEIGCNGTDPQIKIPSGSKVTVSTTADSSPALGGGKTVPLNNDLTVETGGELVIAAGCELAVFTVSTEPAVNATLTNKGTIWLAGEAPAGTYSILRVSKKNNVDGQNPGVYDDVSGTGHIYKGTTGAVSVAPNDTDSDWKTWTYTP